MCKVSTPYLQGVHHQYPKGCFVCYGRNQAHDHEHKTCKWYAGDKAAFAGANPDRKLKSERQGIREVQAELRKLVGLKGSPGKMLTLAKSPKEGMPEAALPSTVAH